MQKLRHEVGRLLLRFACWLRWKGEALEIRAIKLLPEREQYRQFDVWEKRVASYQSQVVLWTRAKRGLPFPPDEVTPSSEPPKRSA
jgi:hypothetical protein